MKNEVLSLIASRTIQAQKNDMHMNLLKEMKNEAGRKGERRTMRKTIFLFLMILLMGSVSFIIPSNCPAAEGVASGGLLTEQEVVTEKFFSSLEATLAKKFFDYRKRSTIRVAVFDFTDGAGNVVKSGRELADKLTKRLYLKPQFDVLSQEKINLLLRWNGLTTLGKIDAQSLQRLQRRINTMDPGNDLNALVIGEIKRGAGRSLQVSVSLVDFQFKIGAFELEKNIIDRLPLSTEIPLPTEQALQEAAEVLVVGESRLLEEGRLLILANTRGNALLETEFVSQFNKDQPFPWANVPSVFTKGEQEAVMPDQISIGLENLLLAAFPAGRDSGQRMEYSLLHGKCATNEIYFDEIVPAQGYRLITSFLDRKTNERYSELSEVQVYPGTTTIMVITFYVPSERERVRNKQTPRIDVFKIFGKGTEILPN